MAVEPEVDVERAAQSVVDRIVARLGRSPQALIPILRAVQEELHYLPKAALRRVSEATGIHPSRVFGVSTFYSQFRHRPAGRHTIKVCVGTACHVKGGETVYETFRKHLAIRGDEDTDAEGGFSVEKVACLGCCMLAPVVQIDDVTYGFVETRRVPEVLRDFLESRKQATEAAKALAVEGRAQGEIRTCLCSSCVAAGAKDVSEEFRRQVWALNLPVLLKSVGCTGRSFEAPLVEVAVEGGHRFRYGLVKPVDARGILLAHFRPSGVTRRLRASVWEALGRVLEGRPFEPVTRFPAHARQGLDGTCGDRQRRLVTEGAGEMDALDVDAYIESGGFTALRRCLEDLSPEQIVACIDESGLMGRGGAGYSTGTKWAQVRQQVGKSKVIICNGDEGDPGAFMDRMILESFPYRVIEGMAIAARAVGAETGFMYVRGEYPLALERLGLALDVCRARGILGESLMGSGVRLELRTAAGAGAFVCGEETALIQALEGRRGMPRLRPPFPSESGLWGCPTLINNVETFGLVPWIIRHGAQAFAASGTAGSTGTKAFALAGKVRRGGLVEVPMGITIGEIVHVVGGGVADGKQLKAVQIGGPSGGCVPASRSDVVIDFEELQSVGAIMGSGGLVVLDEDDCMVEVARYFLSFTQAESCGKCTFCRVGTKRMLALLERLCAGEGTEADLAALQGLGKLVREGSLCGLGRTAPNPLLSALEHFRNEFEAHVHGRCPAKRCKALIRYRISEDCIGCTRCAQRCPAEAIEGRPYQQHEIDEEKCTRCDTCRQVCPAEAVRVEDRQVTAPDPANGAELNAETAD